MSQLSTAMELLCVLCRGYEYRHYMHDLSREMDKSIDALMQATVALSNKGYPVATGGVCGDVPAIWLEDSGYERARADADAYWKRVHRGTECSA